MKGKVFPSTLFCELSEVVVDLKAIFSPEILFSSFFRRFNDSPIFLANQSLKNRDVKVAAQSSSSILVSWKPPIGAMDQAIIGYYVGYKLVSFSGPFAYKTVEALNKINHLEEHCLLTGLRKNSRYEITVQPFNSKGTGPPSDHIEIQTLEFGENELFRNKLLIPFIPSSFFFLPSVSLFP